MSTPIRGRIDGGGGEECWLRSVWNAKKAEYPTKELKPDTNGGKTENAHSLTNRTRAHHRSALTPSSLLSDRTADFIVRTHRRAHTRTDTQTALFANVCFYRIFANLSRVFSPYFTQLPIENPGTTDGQTDERTDRRWYSSDELTGETAARAMVTIERSERRWRVRAYTYAPIPCAHLQRAFNTKRYTNLPTYLPTYLYLGSGTIPRPLPRSTVAVPHLRGV